MRPSGSDLRLLQVFDAVVRHGGFSAAEGELNLSQSTISNHMAALEDRLGVVLCRRGRGGFQLTEDGRAVHEAATRLHGALHDFSADVGAVQGKISGELRIGILDAVADDEATRLPEVLAEFHETAGDVKVLLAQEAAQDLQQKVRDGTYHCGIGVDISPVDGLDAFPLHTETHSLYCGRTHPLFNLPADDIGRAALLELPFVKRGYWCTEKSRQNVFRNVAATVLQIEPQLLLIRSGHYVGYLPDHYAERWCIKGELRRFELAEFMYSAQFYLFTARDNRNSGVITTLINSVKSVWQKP
ncbi:LysR family transcriptional regulator [Roseibium denhamense]|uniref:DNA-binding transcriptional regulator, LysR family n=1 Tax=Roseibium denhamense TaxID=76305 RepID=A0ABY1PIM7_9HYPH|nr:LysR family transcriptional regulator [Roseibium denhamense]MTI05589.1 LysR family transcriptional regulator [Roseibium denhamense]SMP34554.1 DNA-binding transcriptional regulator, LysR family [Roseibium denhamense]